MASQADLERLEQIIAGASEIATRLGESRGILQIDEKSAGQFASNADLEIEQFVRGALADQFPGQSVIGEEYGGALGADTTGWAVDPIDGTSNFVLGLPIWGISIGFVERGQSVLGAIALPDLRLTLSAMTGSGLRLNGEPVKDPRKASAVKIIALGENDFETGAETDARAEVFRAEGYSVVRYRCAVFALAMSALGRLNGYIENGCGLWDIAAADVICQEAGLAVRSAPSVEGRYFFDARWMG